MSQQQLKALVTRLAPNEGITETGISGVQLYRASAPIPKWPGVFTPRICLNVAGEKRVFMNGKTYLYDAHHIIACAVPMPVEADLPSASIRKPVLGISIALDEIMITEMAVAMRSDAAAPQSPAPSHGIAIGKRSRPETEALLRLLNLTQDPNALRLLSQSRLRELYYALLLGSVGSLLRQRFSTPDKIIEAIAYVKNHLSESISIEQLARIANMSRAAFHRNFKQATTLSPVQFIKSLRLHTAATLVASGQRTSEAAAEVGYASNSQFSREFKRQFGFPPSELRLPGQPH